jgi:hypothetical protein
MVIGFSLKQYIAWHQLILATQQIAPWQVIGA